MNQLHAIKLVYSNALIEDVKSGIVLIGKEDGMEYEAVNMLPDEQLLLVAITLHQLIQENFDKEDLEKLTFHLVEFIKDLLNPVQIKGDVIQ